MQLLFHLVYCHSTCFGHSSCPSSGVIHKTVKAATSVCQCVWGEVVLSLVVSVNVITTWLKMCAFCVIVSSKKIVSSTVLPQNNQPKSCISLVIYLYDILRMHGTMNIKKNRFMLCHRLSLESLNEVH